MPMPKGIKVIDTCVSLNPPKGRLYPELENLKDVQTAEQQMHVLDYVFPTVAGRIDAGTTPEEMVQQMDEAGIEKCLLGFSATKPEPAIAVIRKYPNRFAGAVKVDPHKGMEEVRRLEKLVKEYPFIKAVKASAHHIQKPYNDKIYYPIYAKCVELDIPIMSNVGIPAPRVPGEVCNPIYFDEVCWFFPELKVVMTHIGEPWQFTCVKLMLKWPNLYLDTSAISPKYYHPDIIQYMNSRGADKVMFGTDFPILPFDRCMREVKDLPLKDEVWPKFLRDNAVKVFKL
jgi:predicted TIM-barrel fold metal-dependent hydrolase